MCDSPHMPDEHELLGPDRRVGATAVRAELADGLPRWRGGLSSLGPGPSTYAGAPAGRAIALGNALIRSICLEFLPDVRFSQRPTVGERVDKLRKHARRMAFDCTGLERGMLTADDLRLLEEFGRARASLAHQEDRLDEAILIGRVSTDDCLAVLDIVERISRLPIVDELACREERGSE